MDFRKKTLVSKRTIDTFIKNIDDTGGSDGTNGSGRPKLLNHACMSGVFFFVCCKRPVLN